MDCPRPVDGHCSILQDWVSAFIQKTFTLFEADIVPGMTLHTDDRVDGAPAK